MALPSGPKSQGFVENADRRSTMKANVPLLAAMLGSAPSNNGCNPSTEAQAAEPQPATLRCWCTNEQPRSDGCRLLDLFLGCQHHPPSGKPNSLWIQMFPTERIDPRLTHSPVVHDRFTDRVDRALKATFPHRETALNKGPMALLKPGDASAKRHHRPSS